MNNMLLQNIITVFLMALVMESCVSILFSITAVKVVEHTMVVKTSKEAVTFITAFIVLFFMKSMRIFHGSGIYLPEMIDYIISSLVAVRFMLFIRGLMTRNQ